MEDIVNNWISIHIFYAGSPEPLLIEAIEPLVDSLREQGLLRRFFFIRYWQEGPHVRLRLLPEPGADVEKLKYLAEQALGSYLEQNPSLYMSASKGLASFYKSMFLSEYSQTKWQEVYGDREEMPIRPNNSLHYIPYEPEYGRYGGIDGVEVAEWHFEKSSEIVFELIRSTNLHVRSIMLGLSIQLAFPFCAELLGSEQEVIAFLGNYEQFWKRSYTGTAIAEQGMLEQRYRQLAPQIGQRVVQLQEMMQHVETLSPALLEYKWLSHVRVLKGRLDTLLKDQKLVFQNRLTSQQPAIATEPIFVYNMLLTSYIHMTNNRLGTMIPDEMYIAYLLRRTVEEKSFSVCEERAV